ATPVGCAAALGALAPPAAAARAAHRRTARLPRGRTAPARPHSALCPVPAGQGAVPRVVTRHTALPRGTGRTPAAGILCCHGDRAGAGRLRALRRGRAKPVLGGRAARRSRAA